MGKDVQFSIFLNMSINRVHSSANYQKVKDNDKEMFDSDVIWL